MCLGSGFQNWTLYQFLQQELVLGVSDCCHNHSISFFLLNFTMQSVHESGFCGIKYNLNQFYFNMLVAFLKILSRGFINLYNNKISSSVKISVCHSFYFQQNSFLQVISTFFLFSLYYKNYCFFHLAQCGNLLLLPKRRSPSPKSCYYCDWIKLKAGILELAMKFADSIPNLKKILCSQSVSVILLGLQTLAHLLQDISTSSACWGLGHSELQFYLLQVPCRSELPC